MKLVIEKDFVYVLFTVLSINLHCMCAGFFLGGGGRRDSFMRDDFIERRFGKEHEAAFGKDHAISKQGYPDTGSGRYSKGLSYRSWYEYNLKQRAHANYLEQVLPISLFLLVAGIEHGQYAAGLGAAYLVFRYLYIKGFTTEADGRKTGAYAIMAVTFVSFGLAVHATLKNARFSHLESLKTLMKQDL